MKIVLTLVAFTLLLAGAALAYVYSGAYDIAASSPDAGLIHWVLETTQHKAVHRAAHKFEETAQVPALDDPAMIRTGLVHYHEMCVTCHGAPGVKISEIGQGLNPYPPELAAEAAHEGAAELFWVTKHGIKMTGMPSFGATHSDEELWAIVAFIKKMGSLTPQQYEAMVQEAGLGAAAAAPSEHHHDHAPGTPPHVD
jgi:mono/diheme cytochrome c family protein